MILGKILMVMNSAPIDTVDYLISKKTLELKDNIKNYTLNRFIDEIGVSKTSMVRYLKTINIGKFSNYKNIMCEEYKHTEVYFKQCRQEMKRSTNKDILNACKVLENSKRIIILGDGHRFSLLNIQKALIYLGYFCVIPVYLGSEEMVVDDYDLDDDDLIIIVSLHESYDHFCYNRSIFYRDARYLGIKTKAKVGFIGIIDNNEDNDLSFTIEIKPENFNNRTYQLLNIFEEIYYYLLNK